MAAKMPTHIKAGHLVYKVCVGGSEWAEAQVHAGTDKDMALYGHTMHSTCVIALKPDQAPLMMKDTLLHECFHALNAAMGNPTTLWDTDEDADPDLEEKICSTFGSGVTMLLRDNPTLVTWLTEEVDLD